MWIIPKNLHTSAYALDTEALTLDLSELSTMCEQSLMWRSKPSNVRTWSQRWKKVGWMQHLSGRILKPSHGEVFVEKWISSVVASLVNPSQVQVEEQETKTPAIYGHISSEESRSLDLPLFSWKTLKASSAQSSKATNGATQRELQFCFISSENWKDWVINQRRAYSQRLKLAYLTIEEGYSYWGTPTAGSVPFSSKVNYYLKRVSKKKQLDLNGETLFQALKDKSSPTLNHQEEALLVNPRWVDCLMGLPIGWSCPSSMQLVKIEQMSLEVLGMELCHKPPPKLLKSYQSDFLDKAIPDYIKMIESGDLPNNGEETEEAACRYALDEFSNYIYPFIDVANHD